MKQATRTAINNRYLQMRYTDMPLSITILYYLFRVFTSRKLTNVPFYSERRKQNLQRQ